MAIVCLCGHSTGEGLTQNMSKCSMSKKKFRVTVNAVVGEEWDIFAESKEELEETLEEEGGIHCIDHEEDYGVTRVGSTYHEILDVTIENKGN